MIDGSAVGLNTTTLLAGQDSVVVYGSSANGQGGLVATSSSNTFAGIVPGLSVTLNGIGNSSVSVNRDDGKITDSIQGFVDAYNKIINNITTVTAFNASDQTQNGVLFGDSTVEQLQNALGSFVAQSYPGAGQFNTLASIGVTIGQDGTLSLDADTLTNALDTDADDVRKLFTTNVRAVAGGPHSISGTTLLSNLNAGTNFPAGHFTITDGFGTAHDIDLTTGVSTIADVIAKINAGTAGTVTAGINSTGDGLQLSQVGGTGVMASVAEVGTGTTAGALNLKGTFTNGTLNGAFLPVLPSDAVKGLGATLSDLLDRYTNSQTGILFEAGDSITSQETELKDRQTSLTDLLTAKKNTLVQTFANLEVTISQLQSQGTALSSFSASAAANAKSA